MGGTKRKQIANTKLNPTRPLNEVKKKNQDLAILLYTRYPL